MTSIWGSGCRPSPTWSSTGSVAADIGCDHALVCIALVERGISARNAMPATWPHGPLSRAQAGHRGRQGCRDQIIPVLQDGIAAPRS